MRDDEKGALVTAAELAGGVLLGHLFGYQGRDESLYLAVSKSGSLADVEVIRVHINDARDGIALSVTPAREREGVLTRMIEMNERTRA
ncbi:MAG: hypothetical protein HY719_01860 [Planctomycetes bacterium]|nr:hypothetical protein [Planctomycetota bacterium]